nr:hypothetical protein [Neobacillus sp. Marseille-Q6967]
MNTVNSELNLPKINIIVILFISFIMSTYIYGEIFHYILYVIILGLLFWDLFQNNKKFKENIRVNKLLMGTCIVLFLLLFLSSISLNELKVLVKNYSPIYVILIYGLVQYYKYGNKYGEQFFFQFAFLMNVLSVINLYQVIFHRPLLVRFFTEKIDSYQYWAYGTDAFRVISVFGHPIISALFFSVLFICNIYVINSKYKYIKYILQLIALVNLFATQSRSAWITLVIVLVLYGIRNFKVTKIMNYKVELTIKKIFRYYFISIFILIILGFLIFNFEQILTDIITRFGDSLSKNSTDISTLQRLGTFDLIINHMFSSGVFQLVFGNGLGSVGDFMLFNMVVIENFTTTDNMYLTFFFELGMISILTYVVFLLISIYRLFFTKKYWLSELAALCFIFISIDFFFFEGIGWGTVTTFWAFSLLTLLITFSNKGKA